MGTPFLHRPDVVAILTAHPTTASVDRELGEVLAKVTILAQAFEEGDDAAAIGQQLHIVLDTYRLSSDERNYQLTIARFAQIIAAARPFAADGVRAVLAGTVATGNAIPVHAVIYDWVQRKLANMLSNVTYKQDFTNAVPHHEFTGDTTTGLALTYTITR